MDIDREIRKISRALGVEVKLSYDGKTPIMVHIDDWDASRFRLTHPLGPPSRWKQNLVAAHETIYHARARTVYMSQEGRCSQCNRFMNGKSECDHRETRHPRSDLISNLQCVCARMSGGCDYHAKKHGG